MAILCVSVPIKTINAQLTWSQWYSHTWNLL